MIVDRPGPISEGVYMLGHHAVPIFLVDGDHPAIFDAGLAFLGPLYARQIRRVLGPRSPRWCFLTHSHFDHCGAVAYLQRQFPRMQVLGSPKAADVLRRPNAIRLIGELNRHAAGMAAAFGVDAGDEEFAPFTVDATVAEGDRFDLSPGLTVQALATPGHTWDFLSYYFAGRKLLVASEALGTPDETGYIVTDCLVDYDVHYRSMARLLALDVEVLCLGHLYAYTGSDARRHMTASLVHSRRFRRMVERLLEATGDDLPTVIQRVKAYEWDGKTGIRQPEPAYVLNLEARIKTVRKQWAQRSTTHSATTPPMPSEDRQ